MKKIFLLASLLFLLSCLGDESSENYTYDGWVMHTNVTTTNTLALDPVNVAMRFSFLLKEAGGFESIDTAKITYLGKSKLIRDLLFDSEETCDITEIEADSTYAISYGEDFSLSGDRTRFGTMFINMKKGKTLFDSNASWQVNFGQDTLGYARPYLQGTSSSVYYGDSSYVNISHMGSGYFIIESVSKAKSLNQTSSSIEADWTVDMSVDFLSDDYSFANTTDSIYMEFSGYGNLLDTKEGYSQESSGTLMYKPSCSKTNYISGKVYTYDENTPLPTVTVQRIRVDDSSCSYYTYVSYNGYTESW